MLLGLLLLVLASLQESATIDGPSPAAVERARAMADRLWRSAGVELVIDAAEADVLDRAEPWLVDLRVRTGLTGVRGRGDAARVVVGTAAAPAVRDLADSLGVTLEDGAFEVVGARFDHPSARLVACIEDPTRPGLPVTLVLGNDLERLAEGLVRLPVGCRPGLEVWEDGRRVLVARLDVDGAVVGPLRDDRAAQRALLGRLAKVAGERFDLWSAPPSEKFRLRDYVDACVAAEDRALAWFGAPPEGRTVLLVHDDLRTVARFAGQAGGLLAHANHEARQVHAALVPNVPDDGGAAVATVAVVAAAGAPARAWMLDAAGSALAGRVGGLELARVAGAWARNGARFDVDRLYSLESLRRSPGARDAALRAVAFGVLAERVDRAELLRLWREGVPLEVWEEHADAVEAELAALAGRYEPPTPRPLVAGTLADGPVAAALVRPRLVDPEWPEALAGYWVQRLVARFRDLAAAGADTVLLEFRPSLFEREPLLGAEEAHEDRTGDDALELAHAVTRARAAGLRVGVAVSPNVGPLASWPDGAASSRARLERFASVYGERLGELAIMAEVLDVEFLLVGSGLPELARTRDDERVSELLRDLRRARRETWEGLLARTRTLYGGPLGYLASTGTPGFGGWPSRSEPVELGFADALDLLGLRLEPTWRERPEGWRTIEGDLAALVAPTLERHPDLPLLLVTGAAAASESWRWGVGVGGVDVAWQRLLGRALVSECSRLAARDAWFGAAWSWFPAMVADDRANDFDPLGTPAQADLRDYFDAARRR